MFQKAERRSRSVNNISTLKTGLAPSRPRYIAHPPLRVLQRPQVSLMGWGRDGHGTKTLSSKRKVSFKEAQ
jgi:hypothetical protein